MVFSEDSNAIEIAGPGSPTRQLVQGPGPNQSQFGGKFSLITYLDFAASSGALAFGTGSEAFAEASPINQTGPTYQLGPVTGPYGALADCGNPFTFSNSVRVAVTMHRI